MPFDTRLCGRKTEDLLIKRLRRRREQLQHGEGYPKPSRWSQRAIGERLGVSKVAVSQWELGVTYPTTLALFEIWARYLGMKLIIELKGGGDG